MKQAITIIFILTITACQNQETKNAESAGNEPSHIEKKAIQDSIVSKEDLVKQIEELAKPVYVEAYTIIHTLKNEVELAKQGTISKSGVVNHYNQTVGETMGRKSTLEAVDKRLQEAGDGYIDFMFKKECARIATQKAAEKSFEAKQ